MNSSPEQLIHAYLDGTLSANEAAELNRLLKDGPDTAEKFAEISLLHEALESGFRSGTLATRHATTADRKPALITKITPFLPWGLAAAAGIAAMMTLKPTAPAPPSAQTQAQEQTELRNSGYAVLTRTVDAVWADSMSPSQGDVLGKGALKLTSGLVQIEFFSGVSLVVEGDASFDIISPDEMRLTRGKLRAHVPEHAIGFQIHTPNGTALDLGTEFALDLSKDQPELHVIDGEVEWHDQNDQEILLLRGEGIRLRDTSPISAEPDRFISSEALVQKVARHQADRYEHWQQHSLKLQKRDDLIAYFPMSLVDPGTRDLFPTQPNIAPGAIVGAEQTSGRWPGKQALDFSPNGSRVRVNIPGEYQQLSFATWAKIDSLDRQFNALFLTDNYNKGEPHWQLTKDGRLFFSVGIGKEQQHYIHYSPVIWDHSISQRWIHLVTTYDAPTRTCVHYLNGKEIYRQQTPEAKATSVLHIDGAQIGNWGRPTQEEPDFAVRNLNGRMDEFAIFRSVLSSSEVTTLYESGRP